MNRKYSKKKGGSRKRMISKKGGSEATVKGNTQKYVLADITKLQNDIKVLMDRVEKLETQLSITKNPLGPPTLAPPSSPPQPSAETKIKTN